MKMIHFTSLVLGALLSLVGCKVDDGQHGGQTDSDVAGAPVFSSASKLQLSGLGGVKEATFNASLLKAEAVNDSNFYYNRFFNRDSGSDPKWLQKQFRYLTGDASLADVHDASKVLHLKKCSIVYLSGEINKDLFEVQYFLQFRDEAKLKLPSRGLTNLYKQAGYIKSSVLTSSKPPECAQVIPEEAKHDLDQATSANRAEVMAGECSTPRWVMNHGKNTFVAALNKYKFKSCTKVCFVKKYLDEYGVEYAEVYGTINGKKTTAHILPMRLNDKVDSTCSN